MARKLDTLENKKLIKEFNYLISDLEFKNEFAAENSKPFDVAIRQFLRENPMIKEMCINKFGSELDSPKKKETEPEPIEMSSETGLMLFNKNLSEVDNSIVLEYDEYKMKKLYREVAQKTHPDKVKSDILNSLYSRASDANKNKDMLSIYSVCDELNISFHVSQKEVDDIKKRLELIKNQQRIFEGSHLWAWCENEYNKDKRKEIIQHFLLNYAPKVKALFAKQ